MNQKFDRIILLSGGIDSTIGYYYLEKPQPVFFNMGHNYQWKERRAVEEIVDVKKHRLIIDSSLSFLGAKEEELNAHIPFRNLFLSLVSAAFYSDIIYICGIKDDVMTDKSAKVFNEWSKHLSFLEGRDIQILSPFWDLTKVDLVNWFKKEYPSEFEKVLRLTVSCYSGEGDNYCGKCQACFRRAVALFSVGIELPFFNSDILIYYKNRLSEEFYNKERIQYTKKYLQFLGVIL